LIQIYQIKIDKKKKIAAIDLNLFFYPVQLLHETAAAFQGACSAKIKPSGGRATIELHAKKGVDSKLLALNFCNYCLALRQGSE
jgi:hypothetical protein